MDSFTAVLRRLGRSALRLVRGGGGKAITMPTMATVDDTATGRRNHPIGTNPVDWHDDQNPDPDDRETASNGDVVGDSDLALRDQRRRSHDEDGEYSPGQLGRDATVEVPAGDLVAVVSQYNPDTDGEPDPGEIVWTWVPFEEADGRGKDRPVLVVAREDVGTLLAIQLSSSDRDGRDDWYSLGPGEWDRDNRPSWAGLERILRVQPGGMRREGATLDRARFDRVIAALAGFHGWG